MMERRRRDSSEVSPHIAIANKPTDERLQLIWSAVRLLKGNLQPGGPKTGNISMVKMNELQSGLNM